MHASILEFVSSSELAHQLFILHAQLLEATDEIELITQVDFCLIPAKLIIFVGIWSRSLPRSIAFQSRFADASIQRSPVLGDNRSTPVSACQENQHFEEVH